MPDPITSAAKTAGVPVDLYKRLITKGERSYSGWQTSPMGAAGPAQLMPGTAKALEQRHGIDTSTRQGNLLGGAYYLREQLDRFKDPKLAVAAYNAGPGAVSKYGGVPPYGETQRYVQNIFKGGLPAASAPTIPAPGGNRPGSAGRSAPPSGFHLPQYRFTGGVNATKLANSILSGMSASKALEEATTPMEMQMIVQKVPRLPKSIAEVKARQYGGTVQDFGDAPAPNPQIAQALAVAKQQIGKPYIWGASSPGVGFDCSGLIEYAYEAAGIKTPGRLTTGSMSGMGAKVPWKNVQPGDWIVRDSGGSGHVVMYVGNGQVIAAPRRGEVVQYQPLSRFASDKRYAVRRWHGE